MSPDVETARSERIAVRLRPDTKAMAEAMASEADVTLSKWVERLIREAVERQKKPH